MSAFTIAMTLLGVFGAGTAVIGVLTAAVVRQSWSDIAGCAICAATGFGLLCVALHFGA